MPISVDHVHPYDILAMNGASAALMISDIPVPVPVGAVRIGKDEDGGFVVNPDEESLLDPELDLVVAGTEDAILMVEAGAKEVSEAEILDALDIAHGEIKKLCAAQRELAREGRQAQDRARRAAGRRGACSSEIKDKFGAALDRGHAGGGQARAPGRHQEGGGGGRSRPLRRRRRPRTTPSAARPSQMAFDSLEKDVIRKRIAVDKKRPDGRSADEIRPISIEVGVAPRTHGSALFTRGQTQALSVVALGTTREEMRLDTLGLADREALLPPLQLPAVLGGRGRLHARPEAP